jgi:hypothetical protein
MSLLQEVDREKVEDDLQSALTSKAFKKSLKHVFEKVATESVKKTAKPFMKMVETNEILGRYCQRPDQTDSMWINATCCFGATAVEIASTTTYLTLASVGAGAMTTAAGGSAGDSLLASIAATVATADSASRWGKQAGRHAQDVCLDLGRQSLEATHQVRDLWSRPASALPVLVDQPLSAATVLEMAPFL